MAASHPLPKMPLWVASEVPTGSLPSWVGGSVLGPDTMSLPITLDSPVLSMVPDALLNYPVELDSLFLPSPLLELGQREVAGPVFLLLTALAWRWNCPRRWSLRR